jgi:hypothetical protein
MTATKRKKFDEGIGKSKKVRNIIVPGAASLASSLLSSHVMTEAKDMWAKGRKSKFAKALKGNPTKFKVVNSRTGEVLRSDLTKKEAAQIAHDATYYSEGAKFGKPTKYKVIENPQDSISPEVEDKSKEWHGRGNKYVTDVEELETYQEDLAELADLEELGILGASLRDRYTITFKRNRPKLCCDGEGHNLEVIGGDQELNLDSAGVEHRGKMMIPLGYIYLICYETDKHHLEGSNGYPESYEHYFGEEYYKKVLDPDKYDNSDDWFLELLAMGTVTEAVEKGLLPLGVYNQTDSKIVIVGGDYEVMDVGIKN